MPKTIEVAEITARGNRIEYLLRDETGLSLLRQKSLTAWIEYHNASQFGFAPENVPSSMLAVPIALYLSPTTWFYNVDLVLPTIDKTLYEDLDAIYGAYFKIYGPFKPEWRGKVLPSKIEDAPMPAPRFERLVFFSGGVDAVHAAVNNAGSKNVLASVPSIEAMSKNKGKSPDAGKDFLEVKSRLIRSFSKVAKSPWLLVTNNFNADIFEDERIRKELKETFGLCSEAFNFDGWFGIKYLGNMTSAAPFVWQQGIKTLVMGSAYEPLEGKPSFNMDGANPELSDAVKFSGVAFAEQDGFYTRRTEKVRNIASAPCVKEFKSAGGGQNNKVVLWTCFSDSTVQCGKCTKCVRTQLNLLAVGENPQEWGFPSFNEEKFSRLVRSYKYFERNPSWYWDIVDSIKEEKEYPYCNEMLHWFKGVGWREYLKRVERRRKAKTLFLKALRVFKVWRYPHYVAEVMRRLGVIR